MTAFAGRDHRLDIARGLALAMIFVDHVTGNWLANVTLQNFGFSDAAELFVFISGFAAARVYANIWRKEGAVIGIGQIVRRIRTLYFSHLVLFVLFAALVTVLAKHMSKPVFIEAMNLHRLIQVTEEMLPAILTLQFQPTHLGILPLYIALMTWLIVMLPLIRSRPYVAVALSLAIWLVAGVFRINLPLHLGGQWYFNPFSWQAIFIVGAVAGLHQELVEKLKKPWIIGLAVLLLVVCFPLNLYTKFGFFADLAPQRFWDIIQMLTFKSYEAPLRLAHFLALMLVASVLMPRRDHPALEAFKPLALMGKHSLNVFCFGILLAILGTAAMEVYGTGWAMQVAANLLGFAAMLGLAAWCEWWKKNISRRKRELPAPKPV
ncbi:OpgC family protein [Lacibacterium aquatile]|uniref:OpgC family protein n=1 Tax=Lacibacterium aquatile TaxID=1168082 RepID=A0ABW5DPR9_9PROT